ncbi:hypothetical protein QW71_05215 [Paenibacillus sp. IHB B 3415]|uniref:TnsD family Tn7-like transposition protein n=1 Tax=Paenibacillus sp. IHB B 3415 TaxID=867080 RepID=UPI00057595A7|nr:TnsD family Tn7-like transposition protein [Paenibacillus sp. IHB B 3415]KHL96795.1 hypothetical protein QW71_05215 [Paenibacillus sp. IHB B 3415]
MTNELAFFPKMYQGEDFRSTIYRYHIISGNVDFMYSKKELFDLKSSKNHFFSRNIDYLISRIPKNSQITTEHILNNHTVFMFYKPFMSVEKLNAFYQDVKSGGRGRTNFSGRIVNAAGPNLISQENKFCPICMEDEKNKLGEHFLHVKQQIHFLEVCPEHKVKLIPELPTNEAQLSNSYSDTDMASLNDVHRSEDDCEIPCKRRHDYQLQIAEEIYRLSTGMVDFNQQKLLGQYNIVLGNKGYIHDITGQYSIKKLMKDFIDFHSADQLDAVGIDSDYLFSDQTLQNMFRKSNVHNHIILHILMMRFLCGNITSFLEYNTGYAIPIPFGPGPWKCFNPLCPEHNQQIIYNCKRTNNINMFYGEFQCEVCGFTYSKRWLNEEIAYKDGEYIIKSLGYKCIEKIFELRDLGYALKEISKFLNIDYWRVKKYVNEKSNMMINRNECSIIDRDSGEVFKLLAASRERSATAYIKNKIDQCREIISQIDLGAHTRTEIKRMAYKEYVYLLRHDKEWIEEKLPPQGYRYTNFDFKKLDNELSSLIKKTAIKIYATNPTNRIRRFSIVNALMEKDKHQYTNNKKNLPKCAETLSKFEETREGYQIRHIPIIIKQMFNSQNRNITVDRVVEFSKTYRNCSDKVREKINDILIEMDISGDFKES